MVGRYPDSKTRTGGRGSGLKREGGGVYGDHSGASGDHVYEVPGAPPSNLVVDLKPKCSEAERERSSDSYDRNGQCGI